MNIECSLQHGSYKNINVERNVDNEQLMDYLWASSSYLFVHYILSIYN